jgi:hypothetical protein
VRQLLGDGRLGGQRIGRAWVIDQRALDRFKTRRGLMGRPWTASSAWAALAVAEADVSHLEATARSRARRRLQEKGLTGLVGQLAARAQSQRFYGHPSVLGRLIDEPGLGRCGVSAAADHGGDIIAPGHLEAYVASSRLADIVDRYALTPTDEQANVELRVAADQLWPFAAGARVAPRSVVIVDLLDAEDQRSRRAGATMAGQQP